MVEDRWLSVDEIVLYLGVKRDTVYKWIDRKQMPAHKVGRLWKSMKEEVDQWVRNDGGAQGQGSNGQSDWQSSDSRAPLRSLAKMFGTGGGRPWITRSSNGRF